MKFLIDEVIIETIPFLFSDFLEYFIFVCCKAIDKSSMVLLLEDKNLVCVQKE